MKSKISKIMGIGLTFVLLASLMVFALPASASPGENEWSAFAYPDPGADGDWFYDPGIEAVGPVAEAINGDLYAYVKHEVDGDLLMKSTDGGRTWAATKYDGGAVVDIACSELSEDILYVCDDSNVYWTHDGDSFAKIASDDLAGKIGEPSIESLDVGYIDAKPYVFITATATTNGTPYSTVFFIAQMAFPSEWTDLHLDCYDVCEAPNFTAYSVNCAPDFATSHKIFAVVSGVPALDLALDIDDTDIFLGTGNDAVAIATAIAETAFMTVVVTQNVAVLTFTNMEAGTAGNRTVAMADAIYSGGVVPAITMTGGAEGTVTVAQVDTVTPVVASGQEYNLHIKVGLDDYPFTYTSGSPANATEIVAAFTVLIDASDVPVTASGIETLTLTADVLGTAGSFTTTSLGPGVLTIATEPATDAPKCATATITITAGVDPIASVTQIVTNTGTSMAWSQFGANLKAGNADNFEIAGSSDICFSDDYATNPTLFVGVVGDTLVGGDVYRVTASSALDLNVADTVSSETDIRSLDIKAGDALIAGAWEDTAVYYSTDGGWNWSVSDAANGPTGGAEPNGRTYVLWYGDSALAATAGTECAVSMSCGEEVGEFWNQISLIATDIDAVLYLDHSPGYITESETLFMLTGYKVSELDSFSLFRHDGTYWERVFWNESAAWGWMVLVSPDFNDTCAVYVGNIYFDMWRSTDAGCSWTQLAYPCKPKPTIFSGVVIDEETSIAGGYGDYAGRVFKTTLHGARPWDEYAVTGAGSILSFNLEPGYEDPGTILLGDTKANVFISEDGGETWDLVGGAALPTTAETIDASVVFDPDYAINNTIYAAAGDVIARCVIDPDLAWSLQTWDAIYDTDPDADFWGIQAVGDTVLYVSDRADGGGMVRSVNATDAVPEFERIGLADVEELGGLLLTAGVNGYPDSNVLWAIDWKLYPEDGVWTYEDTLATPVIQIAPAGGALLATTNSATIEWEPLDAATLYEVFIYSYCPTCPDNMVTFDTIETALTCNVVTGLTPGTTYYWKVRVASYSPFLSKWSELRSFDTALGSVAVLCSPICGASDVILTTNFSWEAVAGAASYEVQIATNEDFSPVIASGTPKVNAWAAAPELDYSTTYYWQVRAVKDGVVGAWAVCLFTTMAEPEVVEPITPVEIITEEITPLWIWVIIGIGAALVICVVVLIVNTRRVP